MDIQKAELSLIAEDITDLLQLLLAIKEHEYSGYLSLALSPLIGFVSEESYRYLSRSGILNDDPELFKSYSSSVTKLRALLKLFDDTDGGKDGLANTLELFQRKSVEWMNVGKTAWQRKFKALQPDLGIYFFNNELLCPTTVGFSTTGLTRREIEELDDRSFARLSESTFNFSKAAGNFLAVTLRIIGEHVVIQKPLAPFILNLSSPITHNDFMSGKLYAEIAHRSGLVRSEDAALLLYVLSQVNVAYMLLPEVLPKQSNLLFRLRFLMAYHAVAAFRQLSTNAISDLPVVLGAMSSLQGIPNERKVRSVLAHYGFGEGQQFVTTDSFPLDQIVEGFSGQNRSSIEGLVLNKLALISTWTRNNLSKQSLAKIRAMFGDHT